jgi:hypothetical protein
MKIELDLPEIEGYEYTGEYRPPQKNEFFSEEGKAVLSRHDSSCDYPILKKKAPKYYTMDTHNILGRIKLVEIKALEDLIALAQTDIESMSNVQCKEWDVIVDLIS